MKLKHQHCAMQRNDRWSEDRDIEGGMSRSSSRRNSGCLSRRESATEEGRDKRGGTVSNSNTSTPKRANKQQNLDFVVTGKQIFKRPDRSCSVPATYRRPSLDSLPRSKRTFESPKRYSMSQPTKSRDASLEEDMSLELSQVSDFEDMNSKYGINQKFTAVATSTPKKAQQKSRSGSLQSQPVCKEPPRRGQRSLDSKPSRQSTFSCSRDSLYKTSSSASTYRHGISTELDFSSVSPEYSAPSSIDSLGAQPDTLISPQTQDLNDSSCCVSTWQECDVGGETRGLEGEWSHFWANYNNSLGRIPVRRYYDQCPTPYRTEDIELIDLDFSTEGSRKRSPDDIPNINQIIRNEGLNLTPRETQNIIKCAHILGNVLTKAIERRSNEKDGSTDKIQEIQNETVDPEREIKKKAMSLNLKETVLPLEVKEEKRWETVTTQTDISLPNTKSAPKIFEKILRQLSKSSIDESIERKAAQETKSENKETKPEM